LSLQLTKRRRFLFFIFGIIVFITAYSIGAILVKINTSQADFIKKDFETKIKGINQYGIFANNFKVALGMFIPGFGIALGGFSAFSTGLVFNAIAQASPALSSNSFSNTIWNFGDYCIWYRNIKKRYIVISIN
jgi:uncharacterized protein YqgC (DUF456 family)